MAKVSASRAGLPSATKSKGVGSRRAAPKSASEKVAAAAEAEKVAMAKADVASARKVATTHAARLEDALEHVKQEQVQRAVGALQKHVQLHRKKVREEKERRDLLDDDADMSDGEVDLEASHSPQDTVFVNFALKRAAVSTKLSDKMHRIPVRHPMSVLGANRAICLFVKDKAEAEKWLASNPITGLKKIISLHQLRTQYQRFQARRDLAAMYDSFLADERIIVMLPKVLGRRSFYNTSKRPTPITIATKGSAAGSLEARAKQSVESAYFSFQGTLTSVRAALIKMTTDDITENVMDVIASVAPRLPAGGWDNVLSIHIKTGNSASLPVYASLPENQAKKAEDDDEDAGDEKKDGKTKGKKSTKAEDVKSTPAKKQKRKAPDSPEDAADEETDAQEAEAAKATPAKKAKKTPAKSAKKTTATTTPAKSAVKQPKSAVKSAAKSAAKSNKKPRKASA